MLARVEVASSSMSENLFYRPVDFYSKKVYRVSKTYSPLKLRVEAIYFSLYDKGTITQTPCMEDIRLISFKNNRWSSQYQEFLPLASATDLWSEFEKKSSGQKLRT